MSSHLAPLTLPADGLWARLSIVEEADSTLDLQYYQWNQDTVGYLLLDALLSAADRGVEVRLLVDDLRWRKRTRTAAALCRHPDMEVRLFNPWTSRSSIVAQAVQFVREFSRLDRRMHNKLLVADGEKALVGGRNIADAHYGLSPACNLVDDDVYVTGEVASELGNVFETYWTSEPAVPASILDQGATDADLEASRSDIRRQVAARAGRTPTRPTTSTWRDRVSSDDHRVATDAVQITSDRPGTWDSDQPTQVAHALHQAVETAEHDLVVVTPFFVPNELDVAWFADTVNRGVRIRLLTNSLASNNGTVSNSGLDKRRKGVVEAGVELHELRPEAAAKPDWETAPCQGRYLGLHAKLYTIDGQRIFLGSVNLDPRSKFVNTEVGILVEDPDYTKEMADGIEQLMTPENSWRVELDPDGRLVWHDDEGTTHRQPARSPLQRIADRAYEILPINPYI